VLLLLTALGLTLSFVTFPSAPPDNSVDSSLSGVLSYAHQRGIQFGPELVFTYGPLGFLMFFYYSAHAAGLRMVVDFALCLVTSVGLCLVAWRLRPLWRWLLLALFFCVVPNVPTRGDLVIETGLLCWGLLCFVESGPLLLAHVAAFTVLAVFAALAKVSFLFVATAGVAFVACDLVLRGRGQLAVGIAGGIVACFILGWVGAGQALANLRPFLANALAVVGAYNGALGWEGPVLLQTIGFVIAPVVVMMIFVRVAWAFEVAPWRAARQLVLLAWLLLLSFAVWKHGSVRAGREAFLLGYITVLALVLEVLPGQRLVARRCAQVLTLGVCGVSLVTLQMFCFAGWPASLGVPFRAIGQNLAWVLSPVDYQRRMGEVLGEHRHEAQLPRCSELIGQASVDVFGQSQAYALHNGWNYCPRPVFQSYVACNRQLMVLNERFYLSPAAPEYVLFELKALDRKFPALEDARVLLALLANYQPVATEGGFVLLKHSATKTPMLSMVREGTVRPGEAIDLRAFGESDLWLQLSLEPTLLGRLRQVFYRPTTVRLAAWREPGGKLMVRNRTPAQMLAAGFLASPLLMNNEDVLNLYTSRAVARPGACAVELQPGDERYWQHAVRYRVYKVQSRLGRCVSAELAARLFDEASGKQATEVHLQSAGSPTADAAKAGTRPFRVFLPGRWRPAASPPGGWEENLNYSLYLAAPILSFGLLAAFLRRVRRSKVPAGWGRLVLGNALVLLCLATPLLLAGETYFRFFCDTTDSLAYTRISERWVQRHWHVNSAGCRDNVDYSPMLTPGKRRVTFVGDSFTAGHGIKNVDDRFPNRLRRMHPDWEIQVLATIGLDTGGELALMKRAFTKGYQLDQVVLVYCLNDIGDLLPPPADATGRVLTELDNSAWFIRNSYMLNLWYHHSRALRDPYLGNYCSFVLDAYNGATWNEQRERLKAFRDLVAEHGGRLAAVTFPLMNALGPNYEYRFIHDKLTAAWRELDVPQLDLLSVYQGLSPSQVTVNRFDAHPNERASQLAAEAIDKWLAPMLQTPPPAVGAGQGQTGLP
jgi:lysophospholipase L1-like esterase